MRKLLVLALCLFAVPAVAQVEGDQGFRCVLLTSSPGSANATNSQCLIVSSDLIYEDEDCDCSIDAGVDLPISGTASLGLTCTEDTVWYSNASNAPVCSDSSVLVVAQDNNTHCVGSGNPEACCTGAGTGVCSDDTFRVQHDSDANPLLDRWCDYSNGKCYDEFETTEQADCWTNLMSPTGSNVWMSRAHGDLFFASCHTGGTCTCEAQSPLVEIDSNVQIGDSSGSHDHSLDVFGIITSAGGEFENADASNGFDFNLTNASNDGTAFFRFENEGATFFQMNVNEQLGTCEEAAGPGGVYEPVVFCDSDSDCTGLGDNTCSEEDTGLNYTQVWKSSNDNDAPAYIFDTVGAMDADAPFVEWRVAGTKVWSIYNTAASGNMDSSAADITSSWSFAPNSTGNNGDYDLTIGGTYGALNIGNVGLYSSSFSASNLDLDKTVLFRQEGNLGVGNDPGIEFAWMEQGNTVRMAIPESGADNATAFIRSGTFAGPYSAAIGNSIVSCDYWENALFGYTGLIDCNTSGSGADLLVMDDFLLGGTLFALETINFEGATVDGNQAILQVGADPGSDITLSLPTSTGTLALITDGVECIDSDQDGTCEIISDPTNGCMQFDSDDDGIPDKIIWPDMYEKNFDFEGDNIRSGINQRGTLTTYWDTTDRRIGTADNISSATSGEEAITGFFPDANSIKHTSDAEYMRWMKFGIAHDRTANFNMFAGYFTTATLRDFTTVDDGVYAMCMPGVDVDGSGGASANDDNWWLVQMNTSTHCSGQLCNTLSGAQCATYCPTNAVAWNTEVDCDTTITWWDFKFIRSCDLTTTHIWLDGTYEVGFTTNYPTTNHVWGIGVVGEQTDGTAITTYHDFIGAGHDPIN